MAPHRNRRKAMQANQAQTKTRERLSLGALMVTIVISNAAVFLFLAPYA
jgi:hypothetical protein